MEKRLRGQHVSKRLRGQLVSSFFLFKFDLPHGERCDGLFERAGRPSLRPCCVAESRQNDIGRRVRCYQVGGFDMLAFIGKAVPIVLASAVIILSIVNYLRYRREVERGDSRASKTKEETIVMASLGAVVLMVAIS